MAPTDSTETTPGLDPAQRSTLIEVARDSIEHGLRNGRPLDVSPCDHHPDLQVARASFVTLHRKGRLRGCVGHLEAIQALVVDVAQNAFAAAFQDARFKPLGQQQWPAVRLHLSILTPPEPIDCRDQADLLDQLRPGEDGLILQDGAQRGTFLPAVWESLPDPTDFLTELKRKAGLAPDHWSDRLEVFRYRAETFGEAEDA